MSVEHDNWMRGLGVDIDAIMAAADRTEGVAKGAESAVTAKLQSAQEGAFDALGVSQETRDGIKGAEQAVADFDKGRKKGKADATIGFLNILPPVQAGKAAIRIAESDDPEAEAAKVLQEKSASAAALGEFMDNPIGGAAKMGAGMGTRFAQDTRKAQEEGRLAEHAGELAGHAEFAGELAGITVGVGGLVADGGVVAAEGGVAATDGGAIAGRGGAIVAEDGGGLISPAARSVPEPFNPFGATENPLLSPAARSVPEPFNPFGATENPLLSPAARSVPEPVNPFGPTQNPLLSPAARSVPTPGFGEPIPPTIPDPPTLPGLGDLGPPTIPDPPTLPGLGDLPSLPELPSFGEG